MSLILRRHCSTTLVRWVEKLTVKQTISRGLLLSVTGIGLSSITWLSLSDRSVALELPPQSLAQVPLNSQTKAEGKMLYVNPSAGNTTGNGSESAPFKTITQALQVAEPNSVIVLAAGTYSTASGETFPLRLKPSVAIQGDRQTKGKNIAIAGGGTFMSPTFARQNITILGANSARITGVTVTNPNPRGYGLWIESSSPIVTDNTFTENNHDGISITGNSAPTITNNYFYQNGANGMTIYGTSRPEIRKNVFENTGFGINIAQKAAPVIIGNRIIKNRAGIISQAYARPILRRNTIADNREDGVVAIAASQPDLGTKTQPGDNVFRQNGGYDVNSSAAKQPIPAFGNQLAQARINGNVDLAGTTTLEPMLANQPRSTPPLALNPRTPSPNNSSQEIAGENSRQARSLPTPKTSRIQSGVSREKASSTTAITPIEIPVPAPEATTQKPARANTTPRQSSLFQLREFTPNQTAVRPSGSNKQPIGAGSDTAVEISVPPAPFLPATPPPPETGTITQGLPVLEPAPVVATGVLPVPSANIPIGNTRIQPKPVIPKVSTAVSTGSPPLPPTKATASGLRYRVIVEASNTGKQAKVRSLVPGAFRTFLKGKVYMQVGAFSDRAKADEIMQTLSSNGLKGTIEEL